MLNCFKMKNSLIKGVLCSLLTVNAWSQTTFETSESCDCTVDTTGLESYLATLTLNEDSPLSFEVESPTSTFAVLHGYIDGTTPGVVETFISDYPEVTTLVFMQIPGSADDNANLIASHTLYEQGYTFYLPAVNAYDDDAFIASGGVDMFLAGTRRVIDVGGEVGVHSWSDGVNEATDYPEGSPEHQPYIDYYVSVGFSVADAEAFYYFTINAAPAAGIHLMTEAEIEQYKLRTCKYASDPDYTVTVNENILTANLSGAEYQWVDCNNDNEPIAGANSQTFVAETNGSYAVEITEESCAGISECIAVSTVSLDETEQQFLELYPVPASDFLIFNTHQKIDTFSVFDISGKDLTDEVFIEYYEGTGYKLILSQLSSGTYVFTVNGVSERFIVK